MAGRDSQPIGIEANQRTPEKRDSATADRHSNRTTDAVSVASCNVLAIDFLNVLVRAYHAGKPTETHAVRSLFQTVAAAIRKLRPAHVVFAMDGGHKKRSELLPQYKAHRKPSEPLLTAQKRLAEDALYICGFDLIRVIDWEADDVLATIAANFTDTVIASCDKDLLALQHIATRCRIYHPWGAGEFMDAETKLGIPAHHVTDYLALCGDTSDGIPGVIGIGPKTAAALLKEFDSLEAVIVAAKLGNIKGAAGKKIAEQAHSALKCRQVVELNHRLNLKLFHGFQPHPDWRHELQNMRLGSCAAIMETLQGQRFTIKATSFPRRREPRTDSDDSTPQKEETASATNPQVEPVEVRDSAVRDSAESATLFDQQREEDTTTARQDPPKPKSAQDDSRNACGPVGQADSVAVDVKTEGSNSEKRSADYLTLNRVYLAGQRCSRESRNVQNPFKREYQEFQAWQNGYDGRPIDAVPELRPESETTRATTPKRQTAGSLF